MSIIPPPPDPLSVVDPTAPTVDPAILALMDQLRPILTDMMAAAITEANNSAAKVTVGSGTCKSVNVANGTTTGSTAIIKMDGDDAGGEITASVISARPSPPDRCMVLFVPPSSAYVLGIVGGTDVPAGVVYAYAGIINGETSGSGITAPPRGHVRAYGQVLEQVAAPWLYAAFGTTHNTGGEGTAQFRNIDMRGRIPIGLDNMGGVDSGTISLANTIGTAGGAETHTIGSGNLPAHTHGYTPSGSVSISSVTGTVSVSLSDPTHAHTVTAWANGSANVRNDAAGWSVDSQSLTTSSASTGISVSSASFSFTGGSGSFSGNAGNTDNGPGSGTAINHLPPVKVVHWLVRI